MIGCMSLQLSTFHTYRLVVTANVGKFSQSRKPSLPTLSHVGEFIY